MVSFFYVKITYYGADDEDAWIDWEENCQEEYCSLDGVKKFYNLDEAKKFALKKFAAEKEKMKIAAEKKAAQLPDVQPTREWVTVTVWLRKDKGKDVKINI
jgi:hypothetical protein